MSSKTNYPLSIGPTHPAFKEPVRINFEVEGEKIVGTDIDYGYTHRAIEWIALNRNFIQVIYLVERICGICSVSHPMAYCQAIEQAAEMDVPPRAKYIRTVIGELERLHSHLLWAGVMAHQMGFDTMFLYTWNVRESVLDCLEALTGNRINYGILQVGGVRRDITREQYPLVKKALNHYREFYHRIGEIFLDDASIKSRCENVGVLSYDEAVKYCAVGPTARASGLEKDVRADYPFNAYPDIDWFRPVIPREPSGDVFSRLVARVLEVNQSIDIIEHCLANMPEGPVLEESNTIKILNRLKKISAEGIGRYEGPRGELFHYVLLDRRDGPAHIKVKAPTYSNAATWDAMFKNSEIADIPVIFGSIDPCVACADRVTVLERESPARRYTSEQLRLMGIKKMMDIRGNG